MAQSKNMGRGGKGGRGRGGSRPPALDKWMKPAIGVGLALLVYQFYQGLGKEIARIDLDDEMTLLDVFGGGGSANKDNNNNKKQQRFVVLCHPEEAQYPISSVFQDAQKELNGIGGGSAAVEFRLVDCEKPLAASSLTTTEDDEESNDDEKKKEKKNDKPMTIASKYKLNVKNRPTIFLTNPIQIIPSKHLKTGPMLAKALRNVVERRATKIETTQDLRGSKCLSHSTSNYCVLLLKGTKQVDGSTKKAFHQVLEEFSSSGVEFASIDATNLYVKGVEDVLPVPSRKGQHRFVVFQRVSGSAKDTDKGRLITSMAWLDPSMTVSYINMANLLTNVLNGSESMQKLSSLPMVKSRTKKLLQEEEAKRNRKKERASSSSSSSSSQTPPGMFADNDGSREGRRAERERRRQEHYKETGYKAKTPEEQAEMERQRRKRMEEEAAKWNMNDGDDEYDEGGGNFFMEDDEYDEYDEQQQEGRDQEDDGESEEDEDVMDLD